ncbi:YeiH family protein [Agromyces mangrovi Wang et al. 2018]|uniref:YeiH family protein n=1 Tax=Agromyces mangrovi TaxID=1858653 RepID=UPI00257443B4|nr:putative sulfate exporter family transporter [Agromyces mangrovi]BDZ65529.1 hypothetical protein GCM10025877_24670 [Agromyces mangrovi]
MTEPSEGTARRLVGLLPGLALALAIAVVATLIGRALPLLGSALPAIAIGLAIALVRRPGRVLQPGVAFTGSRVLQLSVVLLGTQLSLAQIVDVGLESLPIMLITLAACLGAAWLVGRALGVVGDLRTLIGVGTGICGASAIAAVAPVIGAASADIAYAVSTIFLFNMVAVAVFPLIGHALGLDQAAFALFAGTAVNDTSSVVATAAVYGSVALQGAIVVKLVRTLMIIPITVGLAVHVRRRAVREAGSEHPPLTVRRVLGLVPWFLVGFLVMAAIASLGVIPDAAEAALGQAATFLITTAMAAIGLSTDVRALRATGARPLVLGGILSTVVAVTALVVIAVTGA